MVQPNPTFRERLLPFLSDPRAPGLLEVVDELGSEGPTNASLRLLAARALLVRAECTPLDSPPDEPALSRADRIASVALPENLPADEQEAWLRVQCNILRLLKKNAEASAAFERATQRFPDSAEMWADLSLLHKWNRDFERVLETTDRALALLSENAAPKGMLWNRAIAFTALGRGKEAVDVWQRLGLCGRLTKSGAPVVEGPLTTVEVRVPTIGSGHGHSELSAQSIEDRAVVFEVVRVQLISPCHGVVDTPTLRRAAIDYGDVVLFDGQPISVRQHEGKPMPRFVWLDRLAEGKEGRFRFIALAQNETAIQTLSDELEGCRLIGLRHQIEMACPRCAAHGTLNKHEHLAEEEHRIVHGKMILQAGVEASTVAAALERLVRQSGEVKIAVPELFERAGDAKRAGIEHQAYRGIERVGLRKQAAP